MVFFYIVAVIVIIFAFVLAYSDRPVKNIYSAEIIERIQWTKEKYQHSGMSVGWNGCPRYYYRLKQVPSHVEIKFLVTFQDGHTEIISAIEGSEKCKSILKFLNKNSVKPQNHSSPTAPCSSSIKDNQICAGRYVFGKDIPCGKYNLIVVSGIGTIHFQKNNRDDWQQDIFENLGASAANHAKSYKNLSAEDGDELYVRGSIIIQISNATPIKIKD